MGMIMRHLAAVFILLALGGCASVQPWERGALAHPAMDPEARSMEKRARQHMVMAREASQGAAGKEGGGCGCK